jgi:hypothetical protein
MAADYTNRALLAIHKAVLHEGLPLRLFLQKHDEIGFRYLIPNEQLVISRVRDIMEQSFVLIDPKGNKREWKIPVEAQTGWNLGHRNGNNPDGLVVWRGEDKRVRERNPFDVRGLVL